LFFRGFLQETRLERGKRFKRKGSAAWQGGIKDGKGTISTIGIGDCHGCPINACLRAGFFRRLDDELRMQHFEHLLKNLYRKITAARQDTASLSSAGNL
jgi:hypothetical protein